MLENGGEFVSSEVGWWGLVFSFNLVDLAAWKIGIVFLENFDDVLDLLLVDIGDPGVATENILLYLELVHVNVEFFFFLYVVLKFE